MIFRWKQSILQIFRKLCLKSLKKVWLQNFSLPGQSKNKLIQKSISSDVRTLESFLETPGKIYNRIRTGHGNCMDTYYYYTWNVEPPQNITREPLDQGYPTRSSRATRDLWQLLMWLALNSNLTSSRMFSVLKTQIKK